MLIWNEQYRYVLLLVFVLFLIIVVFAGVSHASGDTPPAKVKPKALQKGDTIGIIAPGSPMDKEQLEKGIQFLKKQGFTVLVGKNVYRQADGFLAGSDEERAADLNEMFANPEVDAIFCARGGYGSIRLLEKLDFQLVRQNPKILMGYSDITSLITAIYLKTGLVTFHGPMVASDLYRDDVDFYNAPNMLKALTTSEPIGKVTNPYGQLELTFLQKGRGQGELIGGNLSIVISSLGTDYEIDTKGKILFLEEIGEPTYRIDRMMQQLKLAGKLDEAAGLIFGESVGCDPRFRGEPTVKDVVQKFADELRIPVLFGLPFGHGTFKATLPIGVEAVLDSEEGLVIVEGAVRE